MIGRLVFLFFLSFIITMGNAVRLAHRISSRKVEDTSSRSAFVIPKRNNKPSLKHSTGISDKKRSIAKHIPEHKDEDYYRNSCQVTDNVSRQTMDQMARGHTSEEHLDDVRATKLATHSQIPSLEPEKMQAFGDGDTKFRVLGNIPVAEHGKDSQRYKVKYYVVQQGQQPLMDVNVAPPCEGSHDVPTRTTTAQQLSQQQVFYLNQMYMKNHPAHRQNEANTTSGSTGSRFSTHSSGPPTPMSASVMSDHVRDVRKEISIPLDRAKDVVPGTEDKYRTPRSSFLNKRGNIKRPMNAFMVWARGYRAQLASRYKGETNSQISIKLGDIWNRMSLQEKLPFYGEAEVIKNRHKVEFPDWVYRPSSNKKRSEVPVPDVQWPGFSGGPSSAALASLATAAANRSPMDLSQLRLGDAIGRGTSESLMADQMERIRIEQRSDAVPVQSDNSELRTDGAAAAADLSDKKPSSGINETMQISSCLTASDTKQVLKAKITGKNKKKQFDPKRSLDKDTKGNTKTTTKVTRRKERAGGRPSSSDRKSSNGSSADMTDLTQPTPGKKKKKKKSKKAEPSQEVKVKPSKAPRSSPRSKVEAATGADTDSNVDGDESDPALSDTPASPDSDGWPFPFPAYEYGPFDSLSPREVPSDEILGNRRLTRDSDEDSARPEEVTSDLYLDVHGWKSLMTPTVSTTKLTDEDVFKLLSPPQCEHGHGCRVCSSDYDLTPKPLRDTLGRKPPQKDDAAGVSESVDQGHVCPRGHVSDSSHLNQGVVLDCVEGSRVPADGLCSASSSSVPSKHTVDKTSTDCENTEMKKEVPCAIKRIGRPLHDANTTHDIKEEKCDVSRRHSNLVRNSEFNMFGGRKNTGCALLAEGAPSMKNMGPLRQSNMRGSKTKPFPKVTFSTSSDCGTRTRHEVCHGTTQPDEHSTSHRTCTRNKNTTRASPSVKSAPVNRQRYSGDKDTARHAALKTVSKDSIPNKAEREYASKSNRKNNRFLRSRVQVGQPQSGSEDRGGEGAGAASSMPGVQPPPTLIKQEVEDGASRDEAGVWLRRKRQSTRNRK